MGQLFLELGLRPYFLAFLVLFFSSITTFFFRLFKVRQRMMFLKRQGLSMTPYNPLFGSLLVTNERVATLPSDVNPQYFPHHIRRAYPELGSVFYLDNWPFIAPILVIASPFTAHQVTQEHSLPKFPALRHYMRPIGGEFGLVTMEGEMWKSWRGIFNPGFSAAHLISLVPAIVQEVNIFCDILRETNEVFPMKRLTDNLTMDIIGQIVLDHGFNSQRKENPMVSALRSQITWLSYGTELNLWERWHPVRPFMQWYNTRIMNRYIMKELEDRFGSQRSDQSKQTYNNRSIVGLALKTYLNNQESAKPVMDQTFRSLLIGQIKIFLFAGHDTTSSSICHAFHLLSQHPSILKGLRAEHDSVFTTDISSAAALISKSPNRLNQLPYTLAIIKETLRLFPAASSTRAGEPGFSVISEDGKAYPTEGCLVWSIAQAIHRDPNFWPSPDAFIPDRWLVPAGHPLHPVKGAWRPFEFGPRNCIGQELVMLEMKIVLVLTAREFDIKSVYEEWDRSRPGRNGPTTVEGERAYQAISGGPSDGLPCRVVAARPVDTQTSLD